MRLWRRRDRLAPARLLRVPGAGTKAGLARRRVSPIVSAAVRVSGWRTQVAWLCVAIGASTALFFVSKIELHPKHPTLDEQFEQFYAQLPVGTVYVRNGKLVEVKTERTSIPVTYDAGAFGALAFPGAALVVALLLSWKRKQRRLLREGREADAAIRAIGVNGDARAAEVELRFPVANTDRHVSVVAIRPPAWIGSTEPVIYDARTPDVAIALADLPGEPRLVDNRLRATSFPLVHFLIPGTALGFLVALAASIPLALR